MWNLRSVVSGILHCVRVVRAEVDPPENGPEDRCSTEKLEEVLRLEVMILADELFHGVI
jgi:hypothetical protein